MEETQLPQSLRRVIERYVIAFAPERIVLFGSYAKGTNKIKSDVDLLIIANLIGEISIHMIRARQLAADSFPPVDVVFALPEEVTEATAKQNPFLLSILGSGITIYRKKDKILDLFRSISNY